jgi:hypothetical protein
MRLSLSYLVVFVFTLQGFPALATGRVTVRKSHLPLKKPQSGRFEREVFFRAARDTVFLTDRSRSSSESAVVVDNRSDEPFRPEFTTHGSRPVDPLPGKTHYLKGQVRIHGMPIWRPMREFDTARVYPGIDIVYYGNQRQLDI